jgi:hypothetical protein
MVGPMFVGTDHGSTVELGDSLEIVAREAALVRHVPEGVDAAPVGPFRVSSAGRVVRIELATSRRARNCRSSYG